MHPRRLLYSALGIGLLVGAALAADNFPISTFGGTRTVIDALDTAGVYTIRTLPVAGPPPSSSSSVGITPVVSTAAEANHVLKNSPGNLYGVVITTGGTAGYLLLFDATSAPSDGAVSPIYCVNTPANTTTGLSFAAAPAVFATGITASFSSTGCFTKTASATATFAGQVK